MLQTHFVSLSAPFRSPDPNPIHKLDSKGGFYAFNAVVFIFLSLLGLYGMRPLRKKLLLTYAAAIAFLLVFRLITGLVMLIALENNQSELIFLLSAGLIEMMLAILALANAMQDQQEFSKLPPSSSAVDGGALPTPIQVLCKDDGKPPFAGDKNRTLDSKNVAADAYADNSFSKSSTLRRSMNANHAPRPPIQASNQSPMAGMRTTAGELIYVSPDNLVFNERSVDAPAEPKKLGNRSFNYAANLTQYSTISKLLDVAKRDPKPAASSAAKSHSATLNGNLNGSLPSKTNQGELITKTTLVAKPFQVSKELTPSRSRSSGQLHRHGSESSPNRPSPAINYSTIGHHPPRRSDAERKQEHAVQPATPSSAVKSTHKRQPSSSFLTNPSLPYRTSTPSNNLPPSIQAIDGGSGYSPQNTTGSIGTSKASIFDYHYSPINLNQISHHILSGGGQKPPTSSVNPHMNLEQADSNRQKLPTTLSALRQNIMMHKMNFLNNNTYNSDQYKQNIINQVVYESDKAATQRSPYGTPSTANKWPRY